MKTTKKKSSVKRTKNKKKVVKKTYMALVLDKSGSMYGLRDDAIDGFNSQIDVITENSHKGGETYLTLITFNGLVDVLAENVVPNKVAKISRESYDPNGSTAMLDAVSTAIDILQKKDDGGEQTAFLIVTISDGYENASRFISKADLAEKIQDLEATGRWTFGYVGANQNLSEITQDYHIPAANSYSYIANSAGVATMSGQLREASVSYLSCRAVGSTNSENLFSNANFNDTISSITTSGQINPLPDVDKLTKEKKNV